jgi:hypothetical protein
MHEFLRFVHMAEAPFASICSLFNPRPELPGLWSSISWHTAILWRPAAPRGLNCAVAKRGTVVYVHRTFPQEQI